MKKLILIAFFAVFLLQLNLWFTCSNFKETYHLSTSAIRLTYDDLVHNDINTPFPLIRFYHNKVTLFITSLYTRYLLFGDVKFLINLLLPAGIFGLFCGLRYGGKRIAKKSALKILLSTMVIFPLAEIIFKPQIFFPLKIAIFSLPYEAFSLFGIAQFIDAKKDKKVYIFLLLILLLSVWWQIVLGGDVRNYCA